MNEKMWAMVYSDDIERILMWPYFQIYTKSVK